MAVMQNSIIFGGIDSADFGIYISGEGVFNAPKRAVEMVDVPGRNGAVAIDQGRWENIEVTYPAFNKEGDLATFAQQLSDFRNALASQVGYQRLTDTFHPDEYRMAMFADGLEIEPVKYNTASEFELKFNCKPQRWLVNGERGVAIGEWGAMKEASGEIVTIESDGGEAVKSLEVSLEPIQAGSGEPSPSNVRPISGRTEVVTHRTGKNLLPYPYSEGAKTINGITFTINSDGSVTVSGTNTGTGTASLYLRGGTGWTLPTGDYTLTGTPNGGSASTYFMSLYYGSNGSNHWGRFDFGSGQTYTLTDGTNDDLGCRIGVARGVTVNNLTFYPMIRLASDTDDTYEPYNGQTYTTALGRTVYGGTLDVVSGELVVTDGYIASYNGETLPSTWTSDRDVYASGTTPTAGAQVAYKLATPQTYQLTPQQISLLLGENHVWSDGAITMQYGDDPNSLYNPTPYDAGPLLAVKGYGTIGFNGYSVVLDPAFIGNITLIGSVSGTSSINRNYAGSYLMPNDEITLSGASVTRRFIPTEGQAEQIIDATVTFTSQETRGTVSVRSSVVGRTAIDVTFNYMNQKFPHGSNTYFADEANVSITYKDSDNGETKRVLFTMRIRINNTIASTSVPKLYFDSRMETIPGGWMTQGISISISSLTGDSTQSRLGDPTYIDCDLGEAYKYVDGVPVSLNGFIDLGSDLPTLASGENEITYDNTITRLRVTPNWWKL